MLVGYARTSTDHQKYSLENQLERLRQGGCEEIYSEEVSAVSARRPQFDEAIKFCRRGDIFVVTKLDRMARSVRDLANTAQALEQKGVSLKVLDLSLDTSTPTGKLMLNLLASVAEFEMELLKERRQVGIEKAKRDGKYKGRKATAKAKQSEIQQLHQRGVKPSIIAKQLGVSVASVHRLRV